MCTNARAKEENNLPRVTERSLPQCGPFTSALWLLRGLGVASPGPVTLVMGCLPQQSIEVVGYKHMNHQVNGETSL